MRNIEYRLGGIEFQINLGDPGKSERTIEPHCFVAAEKEYIISFYTANEKYHRDVVRRHRLNNGTRIVGGGIFAFGSGKLFVLNYSKDYSRVHPKALETFAELLRKELEKDGLEIDSVKTENALISVNDFWADVFE